MTFSPEREPGLLIEVLRASGEVHRGARDMLKLRFSPGLQLLYKPAHLEVPALSRNAYRLNAQGYQPAFRTFRLLSGEGYGWSEFVEASSVQHKLR